MPSPYRESDNTPPAPLAELAWRRRVARRARWAVLLAVAEMVLLVASYWLPAHFALAGAKAWLVLSAALVVATWLYTAPRPRSAVGWRVWLLRVSVPAYLGVMALRMFGTHLAMASYALGALLVVASVAYARPLRRPVPFDARGYLIGAVISGFAYGVVLVFRPYLLRGLLLEGITPGLLFLVFAAGPAWATRNAVLPVEHEWWFDNQTQPPGEWVALFVHCDGQAEVPWDDDRPRWFSSKEQAVWWLSNQGYLPAERALAERLVDRVPTDTVPLLKPRKPPRPRKDKQRVRDVEPRVRVAAEAEAIDREADAIEEPALDDADPPRAVVIHDPDDPRT